MTIGEETTRQAPMFIAPRPPSLPRRCGQSARWSRVAKRARVIRPTRRLPIMRTGWPRTPTSPP